MEVEGIAVFCWSSAAADDPCEKGLDNLFAEHAGGHDGTQTVGGTPVSASPWDLVNQAFPTEFLQVVGGLPTRVRVGQDLP